MTRKIAAIFTICVLIASSAGAQGTLPLARSPQPVAANAAGSAYPDKYRHVLAVYEKLVKSRGDRRMPVPRLEFSRVVDQIGWMNADSLEIGFEERGYDVCARQPDPDAALAFLLSHELTHYYEKHGWRRSFARSFNDLKIGGLIDSLQDDVALETQADYLGGFLAYSAGLGLLDRPDSLLAELYAAYKLPENLAGYPALKDRMALCLRTRQRLDRLVSVFELANFLSVTGHYSESRRYFRFILREYQSPEIYNNIGITDVLEALRYLSPDKLKGYYPLEIDLRSRATRGESRADSADILLQEAILNFNFALSMDPDYAPACLNKACAFSMMGQLERAEFYAGVEGLETARKTGDKKVESDLQVLLGIVAIQRGNKEKARQIFEKEAGSNPLAAQNLALLLEKTTPKKSDDFPLPPEEIDGLSLTAFAVSPKFNPKLTLEIEKNTTFYQYNKSGWHSTIYYTFDHAADHSVYFHITGTGYSGQTAGDIHLGVTEQDIISVYSDPLKTMETPVGRLLVYKNLIFVLDQHGKLLKWVNYLDK